MKRGKTITHDPELDPLADLRGQQREWMTELRRRRNQNQRDFAATLGTFPANVANWETGKTIPGPLYRRILNRLARDVHLGPLPEPPKRTRKGHYAT